MHVKPRMTGEPATDRRGLVRAVVIHDEMDIEIGRDVGFDRAQKAEELAGAVAPVHLADHVSGSDIESGEQGRRAAYFRPS